MGVLFILYSLVYNSMLHTTSAQEIGKIIPHPFARICELPSVDSITGFPFLAGYASKDLMLIEEWHAHYYSSAIFVIIGSLVMVRTTGGTG